MEDEGAGMGEEAGDGDGFDPFEREEGGGDGDGMNAAARAVGWLREEIQLSSASTSSVPVGTPVFLGHGVEDDRVSVILGREASACLDKMGVEISWKEYEDLGHWYSGDMLRDMVQFIREKAQGSTLESSEDIVMQQ